MESLRVAFIGTGKPWKSEGATGFGMAHRHMQGYLRAGATLAAVADINPDNARAFVEKYNPAAQVFTDYRHMLATAKPDMVSVCLWPHLHAEATIAAADAGVRAVHCEKPMASTYGEARRMLKACQESGTQLTINHQRRFNEPFGKARDLVKSGAIGKLQRIEAACGNFQDWGSHWFDMMHFLNDESPAKWVLAALDVRGAHQVFGLWHEGQGLSHIRFANGVHGLMVAGHEHDWEANLRLIGDDGVIEIAPIRAGGDLRMMSPRLAGWESIACQENIHGDDANAKGIVDAIESLQAGREPELSGERAMRATDLVYASYESARRRARVELPMDIEDHPLIGMLPKDKPV